MCGWHLLLLMLTNINVKTTNTCKHCKNTVTQQTSVLKTPVINDCPGIYWLLSDLRAQIVQEFATDDCGGTTCIQIFQITLKFNSCLCLKFKLQIQIFTVFWWSMFFLITVFHLYRFVVSRLFFMLIHKGPALERRNADIYLGHQNLGAAFRV